MDDDFTGLNDRELSPLSSNDIGVSKSRSKSNEMSNHHNFTRSMKRSITDPANNIIANDLDLSSPTSNQQKPAYIPGKINKLKIILITIIILHKYIIIIKL